MKFNVGDIVEYIGNDPFDPLSYGDKGRVIAFGEYKICYVEWDKRNSIMHDGDGNGRNHHCWIVRKCEIRKVKEENKMKFKVGDKVRIRQWDDMEKEFGTDASGSIKCCGTFTKGMRELCGKKATISDIYGAFSKNVSLKYFENCEGIETNWCYSTDMLEPVEDDTEIVISKDGKEVRAVFKANGRIVKESVAKCHPDDKFNFKTGAEIAFSRLFEKKKKRITFRDMLKKEHPVYVSEDFVGGCRGCPWWYDYSDKTTLICEGGDEERCRKCWDREYIPKEKK